MFSTCDEFRFRSFDIFINRRITIVVCLCFETTKKGKKSKSRKMSALEDVCRLCLNPCDSDHVDLAHGFSARIRAAIQEIFQIVVKFPFIMNN